MKKRGINPLIATVILLGAMFAISSSILFWGTGIQKSTIQQQETMISKTTLINFDASYKGKDCADIPLGSKCYKLLLVNNEDYDLGFTIKTETPLGTDIIGPEGFFLSSYDQKIFEIIYPDSLGDSNVYAEVDAYKI